MKQKPITRFDSDNLKLLRVAIQTALDEVAKNFGLESIRMGNVKYEAGAFRCPIEGRVDMATSPERQEQGLTLSRYLGYDQNIIGKEFATNGRKYVVQNININRPKYVLEVKCLTDGLPYKMAHRNGLNFDDKTIKYDKEKNIVAHAF